jgi:hypothetical protein
MIKEYSISRDDSIYEAFPDIVMNNAGELICVFLECVHHSIRKNVRISMTKSSDNGKTWSKKIPFTDICDDSLTYDCPRISLLPDGSLAVICSIVPGLDKFTSKNAQHLWRSYDDGKTWSGPEVLPFCGIVPDKYKVLSNDRHIFGIHRPGENGRLEQYAYYSDDSGKTWNESKVGADARYDLCEVSIVEVKKGTLVAFMRENSFLGYSCKKSYFS